jgi:heat-inducible transcriptional repressor
MFFTTNESIGEREQKVLFAVIAEYIATAEPVGSRTIARKHAFGLSPATIRNIMADLEEVGLLIQPHTSAGRIPTDKGFRLYVDYLENFRQVAEDLTSQNIAEVLHGETELGTLMKKVTELLSALSKQAGVILAPHLKGMVCRHIDFVKLTNSQVLVIFITASGLVQKRVIRLDEDIAQDTLDQISKLVTNELMGLSLIAIRAKLVQMLKTEKMQFDALFASAMILSQQFFAEEATEEQSELYVGGTLNMINQPEFADVEKMKTLFRTFEEKRLLIHILDKCLEDDGEQVKVIIGNENPVADTADLSFVVSSYKYGDRAVGVIGVIGPKRMNYMQVIPIVDYTAKTISRLLSDCVIE